MLAIVGASGKLGFATLTALLDNNLIPANDIVCTTSSQAGAQKLQAKASKHSFHIRSATWDDAASFEEALRGCDRLFLISSSRIQKDFHDAPPGEGRESDHFVAFEAARKVGVKHVYYTSLAFGNPSKSRVMKAHERTEEWLKNQSEMKWTVLRQGLYNVSWPLYFGHYDFPSDARDVIPIDGDGNVSWTAIADLGLATALILAAPEGQWQGRTCYLSQTAAFTIKEIAEMAGKARGRPVECKIVSRAEHETYYVQERGMDDAYVRWWAKTYEALREGECEIHDRTLEDLLDTVDRKPKNVAETIEEMFATTS